MAAKQRMPSLRDAVERDDARRCTQILSRYELEYPHLREGSVRSNGNSQVYTSLAPPLHMFAAELFHAIECGSRKAVRVLLARPYSAVLVRTHTPARSTPLSVAMARRTTEVCCDLVRAGALVEELDAKRRSPLQVAATEGWLDVVHVLLAHGANPDVESLEGGMHAPLRIAVRDEDVAICEALLRGGANPNLPSDMDNCTPLDIAVSTKNVRCCKLLLQYGANVNREPEPGSTPLSYAAHLGDEDVCSALLDAGAHMNPARGDIPLHTAAEAGHTAVCRLLLERGANLRARDTREETVLHRAADGDCVDVINLVVKLGHEIDAREARGRSPLLIAIMHGSRDAAKCLLDLGADVNALDIDGYSPLVCASSRDGDMCDVLLSHGACVNTRTPDGRTALHAAAEGGAYENCLKLIRAGAEVDAWDTTAGTPLCLVPQLFDLEGDLCRTAEVLVSHGANVNALRADGASPLLLAAEVGSWDICSVLLRAGANACHTSPDGATPLHYAAGYRHLPLCEELLRLGADVNATLAAPRPAGLTPLLGALAGRARGARPFPSAKDRILERVCRLLLDAGAVLDLGSDMQRQELCEIVDWAPLSLTLVFEQVFDAVAMVLAHTALRRTHVGVIGEVIFGERPDPVRHPHQQGRRESGRRASLVTRIMRELSRLAHTRRAAAIRRRMMHAQNLVA